MSARQLLFLTLFVIYVVEEVSTVNSGKGIRKNGGNISPPRNSPGYISSKKDNRGQKKIAGSPQGISAKPANMVSPNKPANPFQTPIKAEMQKKNFPHKSPQNIVNGFVPANRLSPSKKIPQSPKFSISKIPLKNGHHQISPQKNVNSPNPYQAPKSRQNPNIAKSSFAGYGTPLQPNISPPRYGKNLSNSPISGSNVRLVRNGHIGFKPLILKPIEQTDADVIKQFTNININKKFKSIAKDNAYKIVNNKKRIQELQTEQKFQQMDHHKLGVGIKSLNAYSKGNWQQQNNINAAIAKKAINQEKNIAEQRKGIEHVYNTEQEHMEKIQKQGHDFEENKMKNMQKLDKQQVQLEKHDKHLSNNDAILNKHKANLQKHRQEITGLNMGLAETNKWVAEHEVELVNQGKDLQEAGKKIKKLENGGVKQDELIDTQQEKFNVFSDKTNKQFSKNDEKILHINNQIATINERSNQKDVMLNNHKDKLDNLGNKLQDESDVRKRIQAKNTEELLKQEKFLTGQKEKFRRHSEKNVPLKKNLGLVVAKAKKIVEKVSADKVQNDALFDNHADSIDKITKQTKSLQTEANNQLVSLLKTKSLLKKQVEELTNVEGNLKKQDETIDQHQRELTSNQNNVDKIHQQLHGHDDEILMAVNENQARKSAINSLQKNFALKQSEISTNIDTANKNVQENIRNILKNTKNIREHSTRIHKANITVDKYGNQITIHDANFIQQGGRIDNFENRFKNQVVVLQKVAKTQNQIDDIIVEARKEMITKLVENKIKLLHVAKFAFENTNGALLDINSKIEEIHQLQTKQKNMVNRNFFEK